MKPLRRPRFSDGTPFVALRRPTLDDALVFAPPRADISPWWPGCCLTRCTPSRWLLQGHGRSSQVPREPQCAFALFFDPGRTCTPRRKRRLGTAPVNLTTKAPTFMIISWLNRTALALAVYASCRPFERLRKTRFRGWLAFPGGILLPTEFLRRVSAFASSLPELFLARF
jgi:hypothetical protein